MLREVIQLKGLNMCQGIRFGKARNILNRSACACADDDFVSPKDTRSAIVKCNLKGFGSYEACGSHDQLRSARFEVGKMHVHQTVDHLALAIAYRRHVDLETVFGDSELVAPPKVRGNLGAVDDIFAGKASDVGTGAADILSLDDGDVLSLFGQRPSNVLGSFAAAQDYD